VNTAARMESNGIPNRIHVSTNTADQLKETGKGDWVAPREALVEAKGKGKMQVRPLHHDFSNSFDTVVVSRLVDVSLIYVSTVLKTYWVEPVLCTNSSYGMSEASSTYVGDDRGTLEGSDLIHDSETNSMLVDWNMAMFGGLLKNLVAFRKASGMDMSEPIDFSQLQKDGGSTARDEVTLAIDLLPFNKLTDSVDPQTIELAPEVMTQLRCLVSVISHGYSPSNPFHNFSHASHVTMATKKLVERISSLSSSLSQQEVYIHSFGIASDPLLQLALVFAALIHDIDHRGIPNPQLVKENPILGGRYKGKSVAEQNSFDIAWSALSDPSYSDLHACLFANQNELKRFRHLVANAVMATDIFDPELKSMRDKRWELAFSESARSDDPDSMHRKAAIVLEHVIQASDVSHTMQHW